MDISIYIFVCLFIICWSYWNMWNISNIPNFYIIVLQAIYGAYND